MAEDSKAETATLRDPVAKDPVEEHDPAKEDNLAESAEEDATKAEEDAAAKDRAVGEEHLPAENQAEENPTTTEADLANSAVDLVEMDDLFLPRSLSKMSPTLLSTSKGQRESHMAASSSQLS